MYIGFDVSTSRRIIDKFIRNELRDNNQLLDDENITASRIFIDNQPPDIATESNEESIFDEQSRDGSVTINHKKTAFNDESPNEQFTGNGRKAVISEQPFFDPSPENDKTSSTNDPSDTANSLNEKVVVDDNFNTASVPLDSCDGHQNIHDNVLKVHVTSGIP